jgi:hypothetical protein
MLCFSLFALFGQPVGFDAQDSFPRALCSLPRAFCSLIPFPEFFARLSLRGDSSEQEGLDTLDYERFDGATKGSHPRFDGDKALVPPPPPSSSSPPT